MRIKTLKYSQFKGLPNEWTLENCSFDKINLIVGVNASGKTRILNVINSLAMLLSENKKLNFKSGHYNVEFDKDGKHIIYELHYENARVLQEKLIIENQVFLDRGINGLGKIYAQELGQFMSFQTPDDEIAAISKRDSIQHSFLEDLYEWAVNLRYYPFGTNLGKETLTLDKKSKINDQLFARDPNAVIEIFKKGNEAFPGKFVNSIKKDLKEIGYDIEWIGINNITSITFNDPQISPLGITVKEKDLRAETQHIDMSQGMFRAISLLIQLNYSQMACVPSCIVIDDIGEGLDYDRSTALINLLINKIKTSSAQLIMSTNDRFVMNNVPFDYWSVIQRLGEKSIIYNYKNSKAIFDDFSLTGLNNFDFFSSKYFLRETKS